MPFISFYITRTDRSGKVGNPEWSWLSSRLFFRYHKEYRYSDQCDSEIFFEKIIIWIQRKSVSYKIENCIGRRKEGMLKKPHLEARWVGHSQISMEVQKISKASPTGSHKWTESLAPSPLNSSSWNLQKVEEEGWGNRHGQNPNAGEEKCPT